MSQTPMAYFPDEPERFVGRSAAMAKASTALATGSRPTTVVLHGMAGAGKTACALELAYRHQDGFAALAFRQAPTRDDEFAGALASLAAALEIQLGRYEFTMTGHIGTAAALQAFLPQLRRVLQDNGLLLVLDNLETLLTPAGSWRDPRWGPLIGALAGHGGESRLILTSRIPPAQLSGPKVLTLPVHALSLSEAAALMRELPNLRALLHADIGPVRAQAAAEADRDRVRRVLRVVQGHPKLLELADAAAADPGRLDAQLAAAETAAPGQGLDAFFKDGTSSLDPGQFLAALTTWTTTALAVLPAPTRLMAEFLACLEDNDRRSDVIEATWADLWRRLERPGNPPEPGPLLEVLTAAALIQPEAPALSAGSTQPSADGTQQIAAVPPAPVVYRMHPRVAATIAAALNSATPDVRDAADAGLAAFWTAVAYQAQEWEGGEDSGWVVQAGLAAAPYLLRRRDWHTAGDLLEDAIMRDASPGVIQAALPALRRIATATRAPVDSFVLARALRTVAPAEAGTLLRDALRAAAGAGDYRLASVIAGELVTLLRDSGRLAEALDLTEQQAGYTDRAGLGPWTQLCGQAQRLQILARMGKHRQVLAETGELRTRMRQLSAGPPVRPASNDPAIPWNVRELILNIGCGSALALGDWQQCLDLNAEIHASKQQRGPGPHEITRTRLNDAGPLIRLGRLAEAGQLLRECQQVFEDHRDTAMLAMVLGTRAGLEDALGHREAGHTGCLQARGTRSFTRHRARASGCRRPGIRRGTPSRTGSQRSAVTAVTGRQTGRRSRNRKRPGKSDHHGAVQCPRGDPRAPGCPG